MLDRKRYFALGILPWSRRARCLLDLVPVCVCLQPFRGSNTFVWTGVLRINGATLDEAEVRNLIDWLAGLISRHSGAAQLIVSFHRMSAAPSVDDKEESPSYGRTFQFLTILGSAWGGAEGKYVSA